MWGGGGGGGAFSRRGPHLTGRLGLGAPIWGWGPLFGAGGGPIKEKTHFVPWAQL